MDAKMSLQAIVDEALILWDRLTDEEGELSPEAEKLLGINEGKLADKVDTYAAMIRHREGIAAMLFEESARIAKRANREQKQADWLRGLLKLGLDRLGTRKMETQYNTVSIVKNGGKLPLTVAIHPSELPDDLTKTVTTTSADNDKIRAKLEAGEAVSGCSLGERGERLSIK